MVHFVTAQNSRDDVDELLRRVLLLQYLLLFHIFSIENAVFLQLIVYLSKY